MGKLLSTLMLSVSLILSPMMSVSAAPQMVAIHHVTYCTTIDKVKEQIDLLVEAGDSVDTIEGCQSVQFNPPAPSEVVLLETYTSGGQSFDLYLIVTVYGHAGFAWQKKPDVSL